MRRRNVTFLADGLNPIQDTMPSMMDPKGKSYS